MTLITWNLSSNESRNRTRRNHNSSSSHSDGFDPQATSSRYHDFLGSSPEQSSSQHGFAEQSYDPNVASYSYDSYGDFASSIYAGSGDFDIAQRGITPGFTTYTTDNLPQSPIPGSHHPWEEPQQQCTTATTAQLAYPPDAADAKPKCPLCGESFSHQSSVNRHVKTYHKRGEEYWACTVKTCKKYEKPVYRRDNFIRHCQQQHPQVKLRKFGI